MIVSDVDDDEDTSTRMPKPLWARWWFTLGLVTVIAIGVSVAFQTPGVTTFLAVLLGVVIIRSGLFFLQSSFSSSSLVLIFAVVCVLFGVYQDTQQ